MRVPSLSCDQVMQHADRFRARAYVVYYRFYGDLSAGHVSCIPALGWTFVTALVLSVVESCVSTREYIFLWWPFWCRKLRDQHVCSSC